MLTVSAAPAGAIDNSLSGEGSGSLSTSAAPSPRATYECEDPRSQLPGLQQGAVRVRQRENGFSGTNYFRQIAQGQVFLNGGWRNVGTRPSSVRSSSRTTGRTSSTTARTGCSPGTTSSPSRTGSWSGCSGGTTQARRTSSVTTSSSPTRLSSTAAPSHRTATSSGGGAQLRLRSPSAFSRPAATGSRSARRSWRRRRCGRRPRVERVDAASTSTSARGPEVEATSSWSSAEVDRTVGEAGLLERRPAAARRPSSGAPRSHPSRGPAARCASPIGVRRRPGRRAPRRVSGPSSHSTGRPEDLAVRRDRGPRCPTRSEATAPSAPTRSPPRPRRTSGSSRNRAVRHGEADEGALGSRPSTKVLACLGPAAHRSPASPLRFRLHRSAPVRRCRARRADRHADVHRPVAEARGSPAVRPALARRPSSQSRIGHDAPDRSMAGTGRWRRSSRADRVGEHRSGAVVAPVGPRPRSVRRRDSACRSVVGRVARCVGDEDVAVAERGSATRRSARPPSSRCASAPRRRPPKAAGHRRCVGRDDGRLRTRSSVEPRTSCATPRWRRRDGHGQSSKLRAVSSSLPRAGRRRPGQRALTTTVTRTSSGHRDDHEQDSPRRYRLGPATVRPRPRPAGREGAP